MRRQFQQVVLLFALAFGAVGMAGAEESEALVSLREAFDEKLNEQLDAHAENGRKLRASYLAALERLKGALGREEKLKEAAQVLAEIESVENGEAGKKLPAGADRRLADLREKWVKGLDEILAARNKEITRITDAYFKALDQKKLQLTRAGKIKEALSFEEEVKRVEELPVIKAARDPESEPAGASGKGNLALASNGAKARGAKRGGTYMIDGKTDDVEKFAWDENPCELEVHLNEVYLVDRIRFLLFTGEGHSYKYNLLVSADGKDWKTVADRSKQFQKGWQEIKFEAQKVRYIRVVGLKNTGNRNFHIVELEAYSPAD